MKQNLKTKSFTKLSIAKLLVNKTMGSVGEKKKKKIFFFIISFQNDTLFLYKKVIFFFVVKGFASCTFSWVTPLVLLCIENKACCLEWNDTKQSV
jgi:hypothetical protein